MTRLTLAFALMLTALSLVACDKNKNNDVAAQPDPYTDPGFTPVDMGATAGYVEPAPAAAAPAMGGNSYTVQKGDTLWSIARKHYGNGQKWQDIVAANPGLDPAKLPVGKSITLP